MTAVSESERAAIVASAGSAGRLDLPVTVCPYAAQQTPDEQARARIWVGAYLAARPPVPTDIDFDDVDVDE